MQDDIEAEEDDEHELIDIEGEYVDGNDLSAMEESLVHRFLDSSRQENRSLADIIMNKIREKEDGNEDDLEDSSQQVPDVMPPKVCFLILEVALTPIH